MPPKSRNTEPEDPEDVAAEAQDVEGVTAAVEVDKKPTGTKAYRSDRNLAEANAGEIVYLDPKSEVGKRLLATGWFEEVPEDEIR